MASMNALGDNAKTATIQKLSRFHKKTQQQT